MKKHHYRSFERHELILRDWLALDRTVLANERTFLAFSRTGLTLIIAGLAFVKFFGHIVYIAFGYVFIVSGICVFIFGVVRYRRMVANLKVVKQAEDDMLQQPLEQAMLETADELHAMKRTEKRTRGTA